MCKKRTLAIIFILLAFLLLIPLVFLTEKQAVLVLQTAGGEKTWEFPLENDTFSLGFTHSVMKTQVEEIYMVEQSHGIILTETIYQSYGVGLPFLPEEGELTVEDGKFKLQLRREIGTLNMTISHIPDHWLEIDGQRHMIDALLEDNGPAITLSVRWKRRLRFPA